MSVPRGLWQLRVQNLLEKSSQGEDLLNLDNGTVIILVGNIFNWEDRSLTQKLRPHVKFYPAQFSEVGKYLKVKYDRNSVKVKRRNTAISMKIEADQKNPGFRVDRPTSVGSLSESFTKPTRVASGEF